MRRIRRKLRSYTVAILFAALSPFLLGEWICPDGSPCSIAWPVLTHEAKCAEGAHAAVPEAADGCCAHGGAPKPSPDGGGMVCFFTVGGPTLLPAPPASPSPPAFVAVLPALLELPAAEPTAPPAESLPEPSASPPTAPILPRAPPAFAA